MNCLPLVWIYHWCVCFLYFLKELQQYLANLAEQCSADNNGADLPVLIILDNIHHVGSLSDIFNVFLNCKYNKLYAWNILNDQVWKMVIKFAFLCLYSF